ncbi:hypothetical protein PCIT_a1319 [Pseudoalteromonas citrea]|uniref:MalT-like TPR region domain-containing protein n=2 Tax=Pseudoalteromonas citrea TaxID=43655 RepID=A0AAD4AM03_9GAMM|nr:tetratricopeptide repeat protein [Pseudoalteromonas citrea]KAF7775187.1 hypothetical protein PCIT_a1319 [Pseudoalteromonas citrea]
MPFKHVQIYRVIAIAILLFSVVTNSRQGQSDEAVLHKIEAADGTIKVEHIIRYVQSNYRFKTKTSLKLGALALEQLRLNPNTDQASRLRSQLSRAYIYAGDFINAERLANEAQVIAMRNNNIANRILANIVQADIAIRQVNLTQAKDILDTALADALTINHLEHLASVSTLSGKVHKDALQYHISLKHYLNSLDYYTKLSDLAGISVAHQNLASLYRWMGMYDKTLSHQQKALSQALERSDKRALSIIYGNLGTYLKDVKKYQDAIQMHKKSLALKEELKYSFGILQTYNRLGHLYHLIEEYEQSLHYLNLAVTLASKLAIPNKLGSTFLDLGRVHRKMGNFNLAESYLNQSIQLYRGSHVEFRLAEVYLALARLHAKNKTPNKAINDFHHGIDIALRYKREAVLVRLYAGLAKELKLINNYEQALKYTNLQMSSKDLITLRNNQTKVDALLIEFDVAEKQRTIITLTQKNRINTLELENRAFQQKVTVGSLLLASTLLFFLFFLHNKSKKIKIEQTALKQVNDVKERLSLALWGSRDEL